MTQLLDELFLSEGNLDLSADEKYIWKTVLRTGQWALTPGMNGTERKPLVVKRDGPSDPDNNVISLSELVENFYDQAFEHVTVPLAQSISGGDHEDIAKNNTGFIRDLKIVDENGVSKLKAAFDFTEPDIKARVERGTIPNTSVGILYDFVRKSDARKFPTALAHVALTHRPWIDKMEPFGVAASDRDDVEVNSFQPEQTDQEKLTWEEATSFKTIMNKIEDTLRGDSFKLDDNFEVVDISPGIAKIFNKAAGIEWATSYTLDEGVAKLPPTTEWNLLATGKFIEEAKEEIESEPEMIVEEAPAAPSLEPTNNLQDASLLRENRFAQGTNNHNGGLNMTIDLKSLKLSELPDDARAAIEALNAENQTLEQEALKNRREARKTEVENKVKKWGEELGLSTAPGFLKEVRRILLSDDGNVAGVLLADNENPSEEKVTSTQIVERLIAALPKDDEGKALLASQADLGSGDHERPAETDQAPLEERLKEARQALGKPVEN